MATRIDGHLMVLDENGKIEHRPVNDAATALARPALFPQDYIVGPVVVCTPQEIGEENA